MTPGETLEYLRNHIDITKIPFSDRGSRLLVYRHADRPSLFVKLAERLTYLEPDIEAYLRRPPFIRDLALIDGDGEALPFEVTTYPHVLIFQTRLGDFKLVFQDRETLSVGMPPGETAGIRFHVTPQYWQQFPQGGIFKSIRNVTYNSNAEVKRNQITPDAGGFWIEFIAQAEPDTAICIHIQPDQDLSVKVWPFSQSLAMARERWMDWFRRVPAVEERFARTYAYAWWVMANNLLAPQGIMQYEAMTPSKINYVGLWLWDSAMHALAYRHVDPELARNQIRAMLQHQFPNGMVPDAIYDEGIVHTIDHPIVGEVTKPPILTWAALKLHESDPDIDFLQEIYVPLVRLNAWWFTMNDDDGDGLVQYNHPYSSGLDDSPLWDYGMPVESPDLNTYLCVQMGSLAVIAETLGLKAEGGMWRRRAAAIVQRMIEDFWDAESGYFWSLYNHERIPVRTPFNLYPLWTGQLPQEIRNRLLEHLRNPEEFGGDYVLPTVARNDPHYNPEVMWRGPVWANINYFFIEALEQIGELDMAANLREKTLTLIASHADIYEYYDAETGEPPASAANIFGWTAAVFIDLAIAASRVRESGESGPAFANEFDI